MLVRRASASAEPGGRCHSARTLARTLGLVVGPAENSWLIEKWIVEPSDSAVLRLMWSVQALCRRQAERKKPKASLTVDVAGLPFWFAFGLASSGVSHCHLSWWNGKSGLPVVPEVCDWKSTVVEAQHKYSRRVCGSLPPGSRRKLVNKRHVSAAFIFKRDKFIEVSWGPSETCFLTLDWGGFRKN